MYVGIGSYHGLRGYQGFGLNVPGPRGPIIASDAPPYCGSKEALQQMLKDLGFYTDTVDGVYGDNTRNAVVDYRRAKGQPIYGNITKTFCEELMTDWQAKMNAAPPPSSGSRLLKSQVLVTPSGSIQAPGANRTFTTTGETSTEPVPSPAPPSGWAALSTGTKVAIGIAGVAIAGAAVYLSIK